MIKTVSLKLINDEKKKAKILSAKACTIDNAACSNGASDVCWEKDFAGCFGSGSYDYCKYLDAAACTYGSYDSCGYDYAACHGGVKDTQ